MLAQKELYKKEQWRVCQNYFASHRPALKVAAVGVISTEAVKPLHEFSPEEIESTAREISKKLEGRFRQ